MPRKPYAMYHPAAEVNALDTHGQSWQGDTVQESIDLCPYQTIEPVFRQHLPKSGRILEAGCGLGRWVFYLRNLGYDITGIDMAADALRAARDFDPAAPILNENILRTSFTDASYDAVISLGVVEHFEEGPQAAFAETMRLLRPGGLFFVTVPTQNLSRVVCANHLKSLKRWLRRRAGEQYVFEEYRYSRRMFSSLLRKAGFSIEMTACDDFVPPKIIGLHVDYPFLRDPVRKWELKKPAALVGRLAMSLAPRTISAGTLWLCRKP